MREKFDNIIENNNEEMCEEYTDLIYFKTLSQMDDPVLTPYTGHIYDRIDIVKWIAKKGTDPIVRNKVLTEAMLVSGRFVKQIYVEQEKKRDKDIDRITKDFTQKMEATARSHKKDIDEMRSMMQMIIDQHKNTNKKNQKLIQRNSLALKEINTLRKNNTLQDDEINKLRINNTLQDDEINKLRINNNLQGEEINTLRINNNLQGEEIVQLRQETEYLKKNYMNSIWSEFGEIIDKKLKKGSAPERTDALRAYASKVKSATSDEMLKDAVNDTQALNNKDISEPRYLSWFFKTSETSRVTAEFQEKVNKAKGWHQSQY